VGYSINDLAVLVGAVLYMVIGALWYAPFLFGNTWMKLIGKTEEQIKADFNPIMYLWTLIASFIAAYGVARLFEMVGGGDIMTAVKISLLVSICFIGSAFYVNHMFEGKSRTLTIIYVLQHVVTLVLIGVIVGAWQ